MAGMDTENYKMKSKQRELEATGGQINNQQIQTHETMNCRAYGLRVRIRSCSNGMNVIRSKLALSVTMSYNSTCSNSQETSLNGKRQYTQLNSKFNKK